jgi:putative SOS response-associated peptidase YedK
MCGRFSLITTVRALEEHFSAKSEMQEFTSRFNVAPSQSMPIVTNQDPGHLISARWGLVPSWAKDVKIGNRLINARSETVNEKPAFRASFRHKRCLVPATHFFEWKKTNGAKKPFAVHMKDAKLFSFAGLWSEWKSAKEIIVSFSIITCPPNALMSKIHDRMPVILKKRDEQKWLQETDMAKLQKLLVPYAGKMQAYEVSTLVNSPRNDVREVLVRV